MPLGELIGAKGAEGGEDEIVEEGSPWDVFEVQEDEVPRVDANGHVNPADDASRLFSMGATINVCECLRKVTAKVASKINSRIDATKICKFWIRE